jgi:hypothetical protein
LSDSNHPIDVPEELPLGGVIDESGDVLHDATATVKKVDVRNAFVVTEPLDGAPNRRMACLLTLERPLWKL